MASPDDRADDLDRQAAHLYRDFTMNLQAVSEICFEEAYCMPVDVPARSLFERLPAGTACSKTLNECLTTCHLIAIVESICIREMQWHVDPAAEVVVASSLQIDHLAPIPMSTCLTLRGWVERVGERSATFCVRAQGDDEVVFDGTVTLVAAERSVTVASVVGLDRRDKPVNRGSVASDERRRDEAGVELHPHVACIGAG